MGINKVSENRTIKYLSEIDVSEVANFTYTCDNLDNDSVIEGFVVTSRVYIKRILPDLKLAVVKFQGQNNYTLEKITNIKIEI